MIIPRKDTPFDLFVSSTVMDFPSDNVVISATLPNWRSWGSALVQESSFEKNAAPSPEHFSDWTEWAQAVFLAMSSHN